MQSTVKDGCLRWLPGRGLAANIRVRSMLLRGLNERLFQNLTTAVWALCRGLQNVIRHAGIGAGNTVENHSEWKLDVFFVAVLTRLN